LTVLGWSSQADAFWRHHYRHGGWGSYGSGGSWGSNGSWGSGGSWGGWHHHRHYHGGWGSYGSSGGSWGSYGSSGGSWGSNGSSGGVYYGNGGGVIINGGAVEKDTTPMQPTPPATDTPAGDAPKVDGTPGPDSTTLKARTSAVLAVDVPADAKVFVNGKATTSTGTHRVYASYGLKSGYAYNYEVKVELVRDGQTLTETKHVRLIAGDNQQLAFDFNKTDAQLAGKVAAEASSR
jgi:uncharacterized protein (TIGR03000 family)